MTRSTNNSKLVANKSDSIQQPHMQIIVKRSSDETIHSNLPDDSVWSKSKRVSTLEQDQTDLQMKKFHGKLAKLLKDIGYSSEPVDDIKQQWRFVKDIVNGYVEAKSKIKKLEDILKLK